MKTSEQKEKIESKFLEILMQECPFDISNEDPEEVAKVLRGVVFGQNAGLTE